MSRWWRVGAVAALVAGNLWLHLPVSDFFDGLARRYGFTEYDTATRVAFLVAGLAAGWWLWTPPRAQHAQRRALLVLTALIVTAQALIVVNGIEAIHYPQYALLAWLLATMAIGLEQAWLAATVLGAADEVWQWQTLPRAVPGYLDWNDIVLNAVGAALGLLVRIRQRGRAVSRSWPASRVGLALACAAVAALTFGPVVEHPFYRLTPGGRWFHLLSPFEAVIWVGVIWLIARDLGRASADAVPSADVIDDASRHGGEPGR